MGLHFSVLIPLVHAFKGFHFLLAGVFRAVAPAANGSGGDGRFSAAGLRHPLARDAGQLRAGAPSKPAY
jgi:hypothetical protein